MGDAGNDSGDLAHEAQREIDREHADALIADAQLAALVKELREVASRPVRPWVAYRAADALERILGQGADAVSE